MNHAECIARWAAESITEKYKRGQKEHGGRVNHKNVVSHLAEELFDSVVYLAVIQEQFELIRMIAEIAYEEDDEGFGARQGLTAIIDICDSGNEYGRKEEEREEPRCKAFTEFYSKQTSERVYEWLIK